MPSAAQLCAAYEEELRRSRGRGLAGLADTFRLTKVVCALLRLANPDRP